MFQDIKNAYNNYRNRGTTKRGGPKGEKIVNKLQQLRTDSSDGSILSVKFRKILTENGQSTNLVSKWDYLMRRFLSNPANKVPPDRNSQSSARGNLEKELLKEKMSWRVFCKGLRFLQVMRMDFSVTLYYRNGHVATYVTPVDLNLVPETETEEKDD